MTICVAVKVHDCIVFAADSASSLQGVDANGRAVIIKVYQHGNKVFNLFKGLPICAMTCGMGNMGDASIGTLAKDLRAEFKNTTGKYYIDPKNYTIKEIAEKASDFYYTEKYMSLAQKPTGDHSFEFWIGGYGSNAAASEVWRVQIINQTCNGPQMVMKPDEVGIQASGQPDAVNRIVLGYGVQIGEALVAAGVPQADVPKVVSAIGQRTQAPMVYPSMPVQDAIRLADFLVDTTKGFVSFLPGADTVGGDTDIAVVTKHEGFKWIRRKHYYDPSLNPLETDHV